MNQLNYHHLLYFYAVAKEGSITKAAQKLNLTPQTISGQLSAFENYLGFELFERKGKRLFLNETGKTVFDYSEDIFTLGNELQQMLNNNQDGGRIKVTVGVTDVIPKVLGFDLLKVLFNTEEQFKLICREGEFDLLLSELAMSKIDLIISDRPLTPGADAKAYTHLLGETGLTFYATKELAQQLTKEFPKSLDQVPFLICGEKSNQRMNLLAWFDTVGISPEIVAEFDDSALMKYFGQAGSGVFCTPSSIKRYIVERYNVQIIGSTKDVTERYYAISPDRKIKNPGIKLLLDHSKETLSK